MKMLAPLDPMPRLEPGFKAVVIVSQKHARKGDVDVLGFLVLETLKRMGVSDLRYREQPAKPDALRRMVLGYCDEGLNLVMVLGGSASSAGPVTVQRLAERELGWVPLSAMHDGSHAERSSVGLTVVAARKKTLLAAIPGSLASLNRALKALTPHLLDAYLDVLSPEKQLAQAA